MIRSQQPVLGAHAGLRRSGGHPRFPGAWRPRTLRVHLRLGGVIWAAPRRQVPITHWITPRWATAINKEVQKK